jgi:hypothetical protein
VSRYFTRCAPEGQWDDPLLPHLSVPDHVPADTGLIDQDGNTIWRAPNPVGFHRPKGGVCQK